jgi:hypothetical protein
MWLRLRRRLLLLLRRLGSRLRMLRLWRGRRLLFGRRRSKWWKGKARIWEDFYMGFELD